MTKCSSTHHADALGQSKSFVDEAAAERAMLCVANQREYALALCPKRDAAVKLGFRGKIVLF
jgi:hypothetical protein